MIAAVIPNCWDAARGDAHKHSETQRRGKGRAQQCRTSGGEGLDCCSLGVAVQCVLLAVAVNYVDGVVNPYPNGESGDYGRDDGVGYPQQRHGAQHPYEHEHDRPHCDERQRSLAHCHPEEDCEDDQGRRDGGGDSLSLPICNGVRNRN